jgi:putative membrane protein insertion efficiency factor
MKYLFIWIIRLYQKNKPKKWVGCCIYEPSCSNYGIIALKKHGVIKGVKLTFLRIKRCNHLHAGGIDFP